MGISLRMGADDNLFPCNNSSTGNNIRHSGSITACNLRFTDNTTIAITQQCFFLIFMNILGSEQAESYLDICDIESSYRFFGIIAVGLMHDGGGVVRLVPITVMDHPFATSLGSALIGIMFAYDGWINVGAIAGEIEKTRSKDLQRQS